MNLQEAIEAIKAGKITNLDLYGANIGDEGAGALALALKENKTLNSLNLWNNNIGDAGAGALAQALSANNTLKNLYFYRNNIGAAGAGALALALKENKTLNSLNLWNNNIGAAGAGALAQALSANNTLKKLNLDRNNIGDAGAKALARALSENKTLTNLNLWNNNIGDAGAGALALALKENKNLIYLDLGYNNIGAALLGQINAQVEKNKKEANKIAKGLLEYAVATPKKHMISLKAYQNLADRMSAVENQMQQLIEEDTRFKDLKIEDVMTDIWTYFAQNPEKIKNTLDIVQNLTPVRDVAGPLTFEEQERENHISIVQGTFHVVSHDYPELRHLSPYLKIPEKYAEKVRIRLETATPVVVEPQEPTPAVVEEPVATPPAALPAKNRNMRKILGYVAIGSLGLLAFGGFAAVVIVSGGTALIAAGAILGTALILALGGGAYKFSALYQDGKELASMEPYNAVREKNPSNPKNSDPTAVINPSGIADGVLPYGKTRQ